MSGVLQLENFGPDTPVTIFTPDGGISLSVNDVLRFLAPDAPPAEALRLLMVARSVQLNPFTREISIRVYGKKTPTWQIVIEKSGFLRCARRDKNFDGLEAGIVVTPIDPKSKPPKIFGTGEYIDVVGSIMPPGHLLVGGWAKVYRKDTIRPFYSRVSLDEYSKSNQTGSGTWDTLTCTMIRKVALVHSLREAFGIEAYDESEMQQAGEHVRAIGMDSKPLPENWDQLPYDMISKLPTNGDSRQIEYNPIEPPVVMPVQTISSATRNEIITHLENLNYTQEEVDEALDSRGVQSLGELAVSQGQEILESLREQWRQAQEIMADEAGPAGSPSEELAAIDDYEIPDVPRKGAPELPGVPEEGAQQPEDIIDDIIDSIVKSSPEPPAKKAKSRKS